MSVDRRRNNIVRDIIRELVSDGAKEFRPGHVADVLRERNDPTGVWQIRGEFSILEADGYIEVIPESGNWRMCDEANAADSAAAG